MSSGSLVCPAKIGRLANGQDNHPEERKMKKFIALYMVPAAAMAQMGNSTPDQMKAGMDEWSKWGKMHLKAIVDMGAPLGKTKRFTTGGASDAKNEIGGYSIVQGDSLDAIANVFTGHPHLRMAPGAWIEITEFMPMPGIM
jgi:hypothetical protein